MQPVCVCTCECVVSRKLNLKFEKLPLPVMYYVGGLKGRMGCRWGWNLINPPKIFKTHIGPR